MTLPETLISSFRDRFETLSSGTDWGAILDAESYAGWVLYMEPDVVKARKLVWGRLDKEPCAVRRNKYRKVLEVLR